MNIDRSLYQYTPETLGSDIVTKKWSELNLLVFERRAFRLQVRYLSHWDEIRSSKYYHNLIQFPTVIIGAIASTAAFTTLQENTTEWATYTVAGLTATMTILASVSQYFNYNDLAEKHKDAALAYEEILNNLSAVKRRGPTGDKNFADIILDFDNQYLKVKTNAPLLSINNIKKHSEAESELFNAVNLVSPSTNDIESAVGDQHSLIENRAIEAEETAKHMKNEIELLTSTMHIQGLNNVAKNVLLILFNKIGKARLLTCLKNWKISVFFYDTNYISTPTSTKHNIQDLEDQILQYKHQLNKERIEFKHEMERATQFGEARGLAPDIVENDELLELRVVNERLINNERLLMSEVDNLKESNDVLKHHERKLCMELEESRQKILILEEKIKDWGEY
tara:strand:+ start:2040 stop:3224 length:1185 start_codon:yes stop_codon:yes gene_type:complete